MQNFSSCELKKTITIPVTEATSLGSSKALACFYFTEKHEYLTHYQVLSFQGFPFCIVNLITLCVQITMRIEFISFLIVLLFLIQGDCIKLI